MTITIAENTCYEKLVGKEFTVQGLLTSQVKVSLVCVTYASCEDYDLNGNVIDLTLGGRFKTI